MALCFTDVNADGETYFRFTIPPDCEYSPNWFGEMDFCPQNVEVIYYDDVSGFGIAYTIDTLVTPEMEVIEEAEALGILDNAIDSEGVYFGDKLEDRWIPEVDIRDVAVQDREELPLGIEPLTRQGAYCPMCGGFLWWLTNIDINTGSVTILVDEECITECICGCRSRYCPNRVCYD